MEHPLYLATYGTLRFGLHNWENHLKQSLYLGHYTISGFELYHNNHWPYAVLTTDLSKTIQIDLFEIDDFTLALLDQLEEYPEHYNRKQIQVGSKIAWIYYVLSLEHCQGKVYGSIPDGDWKIWVSERDKN